MEKQYRLGVIAGNFQVLHLGHQQLINKALSLCNMVCVLVFNDGEKRTRTSPFSFKEIEKRIRRIYGKSLKIISVEVSRRTENIRLNETVFHLIEKEIGSYPDVIFSVKEQRKDSWMSDFPITEIYIPKTINISSSTLKYLLYRDNKAKWKEYIDERFWRDYKHMKKIVQMSWSVVDKNKA